MMNRGRQPERFLATILFTDIVGSTDVAARLGDRGWRKVVAAHHDVVRRQLKRFGGREIDTSGDGFFASFDQPAQAVRAADSILSEVSGLGLQLRAGVHTGECEMIGRKVGGIAVHIAARVMSAAGAGEVLVSSTVRDLVSGSGLTFIDRGAHELKGVPDEWHLYALERQQPDSVASGESAGLVASSADAGNAAGGRGGRWVLVGIVIIGGAALLGSIALLALANRGPATAARPPGPDTVVEIEREKGDVSSVRDVPAGPVAIAVDGERLWIASLDAGVISSLPVSGSSSASQPIGRVGEPTDLAIGNGQVWSADAFNQTVTLIDSASGAVSRTVADVEARQIAFGAELGLGGR